MIGFESYQLQAWLDGVMIVRNEPAAKSGKTGPTRKQNWKVTLAGSALSVGIAVMTVLVPTDSVAKPTSTNRAGQGAAMAGVVVSPGYWSDVVSQLRKAPTIASQSLENDPDPIV